MLLMAYISDPEGKFKVAYRIGDERVEYIIEGTQFGEFRPRELSREPYQEEIIDGGGENSSESLPEVGVILNIEVNSTVFGAK